MIEFIIGALVVCAAVATIIWVLIGTANKGGIE